MTKDYNNTRMSVFNCIFGGFDPRLCRLHLKNASIILQSEGEKKKAMTVINSNSDEEQNQQKKKKLMLFLSKICNYLHDHMVQIEFKEPLPKIISRVETLIYCSYRIKGIPDLMRITKQFKYNYGKKFVSRAKQNSNKIVDEWIVSILNNSIIIIISSSSSTSVEENVVEEETSRIQKNDFVASNDVTSSAGIENDNDWEGLPIVFGRSSFSSFSVYGESEKQHHQPISIYGDSEKHKATNFTSSRTMDKSISMLAPSLPIHIFNPNPNLEIAFNTQTKNPVYVMEKIDGTKYLNKSKHRPPFREEQGIPSVYRSKLEHYQHSGYDRGHMAPAADFHESQVGDTFNLCNVSPQLNSMNTSIWKKLENWCRSVASRERENIQGVTYIVTGPLWLPEYQSSTKHFHYKFAGIGTSDGSSLVHVPTHFFKVVVVVTTDETIEKIACFVVPNKNVDEINKKTSLRHYVVQWTDLECMSGLQFFPSHTIGEGWKAKADMMAKEYIMIPEGIESGMTTPSPLKENNKDNNNKMIHNVHVGGLQHLFVE